MGDADGADKIKSGGRPTRSTGVIPPYHSHLAGAEPKHSGSRQVARGESPRRAGSGLRRMARARTGRDPWSTEPTAARRPTDRAILQPTGATAVSAETAIGLKCRLCGKTYPKEALNFCTEDFGPLEVTYDYEAVARTLDRDVDRGAAADDVALPRAAARRRRADRRPAGRRHAAGPRRPAGPGPGRLRAVHQERRRQLSDALVQGPRGRRGAVQGRRAGLPDRRLRLDRQPGQQRRRQCRRRRAGSLCPDPRRTSSRARSSAPRSTAPR